MGRWKIFCLGIVAGLSWIVCCGQEQHFDVCGLSVTPSPAAQTIVQQILQKLLQAPGTIFVYASTDERIADRSGAVSAECPAGSGVQRWIVFDPEVIPVGPGLEFALAHETAHQLNLHLVNGDTRTKRQELEADEYAARYLTALGWDDKRLLEALEGLKLPLSARGGYPSLKEREAAVRQGYKEEVADLSSGRDKSAAPTVPAFAQTTPSIPRGLKVCMGTCVTKNDQNIATWIFNGKPQGRGTWSKSNSVAILTIKQFDSEKVRIHDENPPESSEAGLTADYEGTIQGNRIEGTVTLSWFKFSTPNHTIVWPWYADILP